MEDLRTDASEGLDCPPTVLTVCGDPVVGRALALLLHGSHYDARFLPATSLAEPGALDDTDLLLITATSEGEAERRRLFMDSVEKALRVKGLPIIELVSALTITSSDETKKADCEVPWPCSTEELQRQIDDVLVATGNRRSSTKEARCER